LASGHKFLKIRKEIVGPMTLKTTRGGPVFDGLFVGDTYSWVIDFTNGHSGSWMNDEENFWKNFAFSGKNHVEIDDIWADSPDFNFCLMPINLVKWRD
jgi:hypothetical protein